MTIEERFWAKVEKTDGCWVWLAGRTGRPGKAKAERFGVSQSGVSRIRSREVWAHV